MNNIHTILPVIALILALILVVAGLIKPTWSLVTLAVAVLLLAVNALVQ